VKQADAAISFVNREEVAMSRCFPWVVFEVAFPQSYDTWKEDARYWLVKSEGPVKLAVIIFLEEGSRVVGKAVDHDMHSNSYVNDKESGNVESVHSVVHEPSRGPRAGSSLLAAAQYRLLVYTNK
jgi:hypothetical protein